VLGLKEIRPAERRATLAAFFTVGGIMAAHELLETARDALFLATVPAARLPWLYLAIAFLGMVVARGPVGRLGRTFGARALGIVLVASAAITAGFWFVVDPDAVWSLYATYVWSGLFATVVVVQFWSLLGRLYTATQAKRIFRFVGVGAILGAIAGSLQAAAIAVVAPANVLLLAAGGTLLIAAIGPAFLAGASISSGRTQVPSIADCVHQVAEHIYTRRLAWLVFTATLSFTAIDYVFKSVVADSIAPEDLGRFFAAVNVALNVGSLLAQGLLARWLLRHVGLHRGAALLPLLIFLGAIGVALTGALVAVLILKGADGSLRHSVHRTANELFYVPMSDGTRDAAKAFIDMAVQRGGQAVASLAILGVVSWLGPFEQGIAAAAAALAAVWLVIVFGLRKPYFDLFRRTLDAQAVQARVDFPQLDASSMESLLAGLNSTNDDEVLAVIDLFAAQDKVALLPDLLLYHPSQRVVRRVLELFPGCKGPGAARLVDRLLDSDSEDVRAGALRARRAIAPDPELLRRALDDPSPRVRAVALVGLAALDPNADAHDALAELVDGGSLVEQRAIAGALADDPSDDQLDLLLELATLRDLEVRNAVCRAFAELADPRAASALLPMLEQRAVRDAARAALVAIGDPALELLDHALDDRSWPARVRQHIPRTISRFAPDAAAAVMVDHLVREPDGVVRFKLLRGLGRLRSENPEIALDPAPLERRVSENLTKAYRSLHWRGVLEASDELVQNDTLALLIALLADKEWHAVERITRLIGLLHPHEDLEEIHRGLSSSEPRTQSSSRELLSDLAPPRARDSLLALVDDLPAADRLAQAAPFYVPRASEPLGVFNAILDAGSESLGCLVVHYAGEVGLEPLRGRLTSAAAASTGPLAEAASRALHRLDQRGATGG
jgi:ATP/ADP translocase/HEAT repeat protein